MKATSAIVGPYDDVVMPRGSRKMDWEVELGVVIGKPAKYVTEDDALSHVAGYCVVNDFSERAFQLEGTGQWVKGKSADTFGPIGPWFVTADEIPDPQVLDLWVDVDPCRFQNGSTSRMSDSSSSGLRIGNVPDNRKDCPYRWPRSSLLTAAPLENIPDVVLV